MPVCVAGMHRSGTSLVARLLNLCGYNLGPHEACAIPAADNPGGFWENARFVDINERMLSLLGGGWDCPPRDLEQLASDELSALRTEARALVEEMNEHPLWCWKDPRNSLTMPFWNSVLTPKLVVCLRNPLEVAGSLAKRNHFSKALSLDLWKRYNQEVLKHSKPGERIITHYASYFPDPRLELERLLSFVGIEPTQEMLDRCCGEVFDEQRHHHHGDADVRAQDVPADIAAFYETMCEEAQVRRNVAKPARPKRRLAQLSPAVHAGLQLAPSDFVDARIELLKRGLHEQLHLLERKNEALAQRDAAIRALRNRVAQSSADIRAAADQAKAIEARSAQHFVDMQKLRRTLEQLEGSLGTTKTDLAQREETIRRLSAQLNEYRDHVDRLEATIADLALAQLHSAQQKDLVHQSQPAGTQSQRLAKAGSNGTSNGHAKDSPRAAKVVRETRFTRYRRIVNRIRQVAELILAPTSIVAVVSKGDEQLTKLNHRTGWHFPQSSDGAYAGYYPLNSAAAIEEIEAMRSKGAEALVFPSTAFWWLDHYEEFREHLDHYYHTTWVDEDCIVYDLSTRSCIEREVSRKKYRAYPATTSDYDVVCFSVIDWQFRFQRPQQILTQFAQAGHRVFYCNITFHQTGIAPAIHQIAENIYGVQLPGPPGLSPYRDEIDADSLEGFVGALEVLRQQAEISTAVSLVHLPFWRPLADAMRERAGWKIVYDCMDEHAGFSTNNRSMLRHEDALIAESDLVVATSDLLYQKVVDKAQQSLLLPNAVDFEHFNKPAETQPLDGISRPIIGYYGAIADWFDIELIRTAAAKKPNWQFVMIGHTFGADISSLAALSNVHFLGEKPYASLPDYLHQFDVACIPFKLNELTLATNPVKFYEYLAAGKPVVSVELPELVPYTKLFYPAGTANEFVKQIGAALKEKSKAKPRERIELARQNTWADRHQVLSERIPPLFGKAAIVIVSFNNLEYLKLCLASILAKTLYPNFEIVVVDNGSDAEVLEFLADAAKADPRIRAIVNGSNLGFARATNIGIEAARDCETIIMLNDDTVVTRGWLAKMLWYLAQPNIGMVGPVTNWAGNEAKIEVDYDTIDDMDDFAAMHAENHAGHHFDPHMLAMFCVGIRMSLLNEIGLLDERFGIGMFEDDDFSRRVIESGRRVVCAEDVFIHHWGRSSFKKLDPDDYTRLFEENRKKFEDKWATTWVPHQDRSRRNGKSLLQNELKATS